ncbi:thiamine pyrophosphate-binding protein [Chloroflexota bacterium]
MAKSNDNPNENTGPVHSFGGVLPRAEYGSDVIADLLEVLDVEYITFNPGASFAPLHDSIVNYGGNNKPKVVLCCHEGVAVDIARGYNIVADKPMLAIVHNLVGLLQANMAIYNALLDRVPVLVLGATGPLVIEDRRPWIDWIHTSIDQSNVVRDYVKWDNQALSVTGAIEGILRGYKISNTEPKGPVYVCLDYNLQVAKLDKTDQPLSLAEVSRYTLPVSFHAAPDDIKKAAELLIAAKNPVAMADNLARKPQAFKALIELAETLSLPVFDTGTKFSFPTNHPLQLTGSKEELLKKADLVLLLDIIDPELSVKYINIATPFEHWPKAAKFIDISLRNLATKGWAEDYGRLQPMDLDITADTSFAIPALAAACQEILAVQPEKQKQIRERFDSLKNMHDTIRANWKQEAEKATRPNAVTKECLAAEIWSAIKDEDVVTVNNTTTYDWPKKLWDISEPYQYVGGGGGGGIGFGIGRAIGVALANKLHNRICVDIQPDGDLLYTPSGLWTLANQQLPLLVIMYNNRAYYNTVNHQKKYAVNRGRPVANKGIGTTLVEPQVDFVKLAESFNIYGQGPIENPAALRQALKNAIAHIKKTSQPALIDVVVSME